LIGFEVTRRTRRMTSRAMSGVACVSITIRAWYPDATPSDIGAMRSLVSKALESLYGGLAAIPLGWLLLMSLPLWGFPSTPPRRSGWL
jgi:hypothetical protein